MKVDGWIYDAYQEQDQIVVWVSTAAGCTIKFTDSFLVEVCASPKRHTAVELAQIISDHPLVESASTCSRYKKTEESNLGI